MIRRAGGTTTVLLGLVVVWGFFQASNDNFLSARNLSNLLLQIAVLGTLAVGMVMVLVLGEIDLSVGAVAGVSAAVLARLLADHGAPAGLAVAAALLTGALIGLVHGLVITSAGIPSFIITLAGLLVWQGAQLALVGDGGQIPIRDTAIRSIASSYVVPAFGWVLALLVVAGFAGLRAVRRTRRARHGLANPPVLHEVPAVAAVAVFAAAVTWLLNSYFGIPWVFVLLLLLVGGAGVLMTGTAFGRHVTAIGGNREAARRAGIPVARTMVVVFVLVSAIAALAGVVEASRQFSASNALGGGTLQLNAIAAAVIGGTSLFGGRGRIYHAVLGALVVGSVQNGLDLLGEPAAVKNIATGVILVVAVVLDAVSRRRRLARGAAD
ncbi:sugar ABC transporter permease [Dactylosporangium sp. AC04546]|uniref:sugar ABC transporter permease n=1 Tax=Dactylosporangium sp. AC04546 TaxID=2862460 RepID=UPI001EDD419A|nr:sugar ABC transporter permease [Dactylosporangium sp. AC04546]WVK81221.1 sugar ABC transporter permease [Dactylosporangium sp. AC04546]